MRALTPHGSFSHPRYVKQAKFDANTPALLRAWTGIVAQLVSDVGKTESAPGTLHLERGTYHVVHCSSPEYKCYPPFEDRACTIGTDCNYELSQLRWGLSTALDMASKYGLQANLTAAGVDASWWQDLLDGKLVYYPIDERTGFRLDANCAFDCPHRHFSHLLQVFDLQTVECVRLPARPHLQLQLSFALTSRQTVPPFASWLLAPLTRSPPRRTTCLAFQHSPIHPPILPIRHRLDC